MTLRMRAPDRRTFLATTGLFTLAACGGWRPAVAQGRTPQPLPSPNAPRNQNVPGGLDTHPTDSSATPPVARVDAAQLEAMVQDLYRLAGELKAETDRVNLRDTLPADFLKRAQQIEKLAKNIRNEARG